MSTTPTPDELPIHPWSPSAFEQRERAEIVLMHDDVAKAASAILWSNQEKHEFVDWPADSDDAFAIAEKVLTTLGFTVVVDT